MINYDKPLNTLDETRIKPLKKHIKDNDLRFKYFSSINYDYPMFDYDTVLKDQKFISKHIRSLYKHDLNMLFFIEKHTKDPDSNFYNGYHHYGNYVGGLICEWENPDELEKDCSMSKKSYSEVSKAMTYLDL